MRNLKIFLRIALRILLRIILHGISARKLQNGGFLLCLELAREVNRYFLVNKTEIYHFSYLSFFLSFKTEQ